MHRRPLRRAVVLALATSLTTSAVVSADGLLGDADLQVAGRQSIVDLGVVAPGAELSATVGFELVCSGTSHPDHGQSVTLTPMLADLPSGAAVVTFPGTAVGPTPDTWPLDGAACPSPLPVLASGPVEVVFRAPLAVNSYVATFAWRRSLAPAGLSDSTALTGSATGVSFRFEVVPDAPPTLMLPADLLVEADTVGGWTAAYEVGASDAEDEPDPTPVCAPAPGDLLALGVTTVACQVTDSRGQTATGSFGVTVLDTTAPAIAAIAAITIETPDPAGAPVTFDAPSAVDTADPQPDIACHPVSGSHFEVGTTRVGCTATDASGNSASTAFDVRVGYVPVPVASATWLEPVGVADGGTFVTNHGRTLPVKVTLAIDGVERTTGTAELGVEACGGGPVKSLPLAFGGGRWHAALDTADLVGGCHVVTAWIDGLDAGAFRLASRATETATRPGSARR